MIVLLDSVLGPIDTALACREPEHGGLLVGGDYGTFITHVLLDGPERPHVEAWWIHEAITQDLLDLETVNPWVRLASVIHLHPRGYDRPSMQDLRAALDLSARNTTFMPQSRLPIVTRWVDLPARAAEQLGDHEIALQHGKISFYIVEQPTPDGPPAIRTERPRIMPLERDMRSVAAATGGVAGEISTTELDGVFHAEAPITSPDGSTLRVFVPVGYPAMAPTIAISTVTDAFESIPVTWDLSVPDEHRLLNAIERLDSIPTRRRVQSASGHVEGTVEPEDEALTARVTTPLGGSVDGLRVVIIGLGSVGSTIADTLARSGVDRFTLVDPDTVSGANLSRSPYVRHDIGTAKTTALEAHLRRINPAIQVEAFTDDITSYDAHALETLLDEAALAIAATDDPTAQALLNAATFHAGCPSVYIGLYARAAAGEVLLTVPGQTRCYRCATPGRHHQPDQIATDYGTGRLEGEPALGCDIVRVTMAGARMALGLLAIQTGADTALTRHVTSALARGEQFLIMSTEPDWGLFEGLMDGVAGQNGFGSVWLTVDEDPTCDICGDHPLDLASICRPPSDRVAMAAALAVENPRPLVFNDADDTQQI